MKRKTFDGLLSAGGMLVVAVLVVAGSLLTWGTHYINSNVHNQLASQQIFFPPAAAFAHAKAGTEITPSMIPSVFPVMRGSAADDRCASKEALMPTTS